MRFGKSVKLLSLLAFAGPSVYACDEIHGANDDLQSRLEMQTEVQSKFDDALSQEVNRCQSEASRISQKAAQVAGAQSCVALQESSAMNHDLTAISDECSQKFLKMQLSEQFVKESIFAPFRSSIDAVVQDDQSDTFLQRVCPSQLNETADILNQTDRLLSRSERGIAKAKNHFEKFSALGNQTRQFEEVTQAGYSRCVAEQKPLVNQESPYGYGGQAQVPVPAAPSNQGGNTITGYEQDKAKQDNLPQQ